MVRLKTEHHAICTTQENIPTTNILTLILTIQISNQPLINKKWSKHVKIYQTQLKQLCSKANAMELAVRLICSFPPFFFMKIEEKKSDCFRSNKVLIHLFIKGV